jgi:hypothetical protein
MKGQQEIMTLIIITGILFAVVASVWLWANPIIEKNKEIFTLQRTEDFTKILASTIKLVAKNGGKSEISLHGLNPKGTILITETEIEIFTLTKDSFYEKSIAIPINDVDCTATNGTWGLEKSDIICVTSVRLGGEKEGTRTRYSIKFIEMDSGNSAYKIVLLPTSERSGLDKNSVIIENKGIKEGTSNGRNLISTLIAISIV